MRLIFLPIFQVLLTLSQNCQSPIGLGTHATFMSISQASIAQLLLWTIVSGRNVQMSVIVSLQVQIARDSKPKTHQFGQLALINVAILMFRIPKI